MAFDETLAQRIRDALANEVGVSERKMFGGIAFMVNGNMAVGVSSDELMLRVGSDGEQKVLSLPGVRPFDKTGKPMRGWVLVESWATADDAVLTGWVDRGLAIAGSLPPK